MSRGVNKVLVIGHLGQDPETRFFQDGSAVTNISVATSESWKDKQTGERKERTEWHRIALRDRGNYKLAQIAGECLKKGSQVYIEGKLQTRKWQDKDGNDRYTTEIVADQMQMLGEQRPAKTHQQGMEQVKKDTGLDDPGFQPDDDIPFSQVGA